MTTKAMGYRPEIDGMRTVAVMAVILNHAGIAFVPGGFVGVDIFFVISGFLITGIIADEIEAGHFTVARFFERRARRILPAAFVVMAVSLIAGWFLMGADAYENLGQSVVATTLFSNNVLLTLTSGYWELESSFKPLLHTWSLGVEEQYYFIVPFAMLAAYRFFRAQLIWLVAAIGAGSFAACLYMQTAHPIANFFLLPSRAWEIAAGALAILLVRKLPENPLPDWLAPIGLCLILIAITCFSEATPTPSIYAMVPVIGTVLVLVCCRGGMSHRILSSGPMVAIGQISYSAYLWHQPLYAFLRVASTEKPSVPAFAALIPVTLGLAYLSWRFIEAPFRNRSTFPLGKVVALLLASALLLVGCGLALSRLGGLPSRLPQPANAEPPGSFVPYNMRIMRYKRDAFREADGSNLLIIGNSTGRDFANIVIESGRFAAFDIVYRDDLKICDIARFADTDRVLVAQASLVVVAYNHLADPLCDIRALSQREDLRGRLVFIGPKDFGDNLNVVARIPLAERSGRTVRISDAGIAAQRYYKARTPAEIYIDVVGIMSPDGMHMPAFDESGRMLSEDRVHLTRAGAGYFARRIFSDSAWSRVITAPARREAPGSR